MKKIKVGIIGASGYVGQELAAVLAEDPFIGIVFLNSGSKEGARSEFIELNFENLTPQEMLDREIVAVFFATPHGVAMKEVGFFLRQGVKVIDLSADFRFSDPAVFEKTYNIKHCLPNEEAIFGLTEIFLDKLKNVALVANPGCYVTSCLFAAWPLREKFSLAIFDSKSGWSGAGKKFSLHKEVKENIIPYKLVDHRHLPEIQQFFSQPIFFTPHLLPTFRGIETTAHFILDKKRRNEDFYELFCEFYDNFPYVKIQKEIPSLSDIKAKNSVVLGGFEMDEKGRLVIVSVLDNLRKGAASQAVQNLHAIFDLPPEIPQPRRYLEV